MMRDEAESEFGTAPVPESIVENAGITKIPTL